MTHRIQVMTTCSAEGWAATGKRMAESFIERWPLSCLPLIVYAEGFAPDMPGIEVRGLPAWLQSFKERHRGDPRANGRSTRGYDYRFDAVKFAHKVAAIEEAARHQIAKDGETIDYLVWMDADTVTHAQVTERWLSQFLPGPDEALAWLDRVGMYPECGFLVFNLAHHDAYPVLAEWRRLYWSDGVFGLPETHDSFVLEHVVKQTKAPWRSLSGMARRKQHPMALGPLAQCLDHLKGNRKTMPFSPEHRILAS